MPANSPFDKTTTKILKDMFLQHAPHSIKIEHSQSVSQVSESFQLEAGRYSVIVHLVRSQYRACQVIKYDMLSDPWWKNTTCIQGNAVNSLYK